MSLFREQAVEAKRNNSWLGAVNLGAPLSVHVVSLIAIILSLVLLAFALFGHYTRRANAVGTILPVTDLAVVRSATDGVVTPLVPLGQFVRAGDMVARLSGVPVLAPTDGMVYRAAPGRPVQADSIVVSILPLNRGPRVELLVDEQAIGLVKTGAPVTLRYRAFPPQSHGTYNGTVEWASHVPVPSQPTELYRVLVRVQEPVIDNTVGAPIMVETGMSVDAEIFLERRRLIEWALSPMLDRRGKTR